MWDRIAMIAGRLGLVRLCFWAIRKGLDSEFRRTHANLDWLIERVTDDKVATTPRRPPPPIPGERK